MSDIGSPTARVRGKKRVAWREDAEIVRRISEVDRLHCAGYTNLYIAAQLGVDEGTVRADIKRGAELYRERASDDVATQRAERIRVLEGVLNEALEQARWDHACERAVLFGESVKDRDGKDLTLALPEIPDDFRGVIKMPDFRSQKTAALNVARAAAMDIAKLQGIVIDKVSPTDPDGKALDLAALVAIARKEG